jgi:hypothetical protein
MSFIIFGDPNCSLRRIAFLILSEAAAPADFYPCKIKNKENISKLTNFDVKLRSLMVDELFRCVVNIMSRCPSTQEFCAKCSDFSPGSGYE